MLVSEVIRRYLEVGCKHFAPDTVAERKFILGKVSEAIGTMDIADCKPFHLLEFLERQETWRAHTTRAGRTHRILSVFNWATSLGLISKNPFMEGKSSPYASFIGGIDSDCGYPGLSDDDFSKLLTACKSDRLKRAMLFLRYTGARPIEMRRLTWAQIKYDKNVIEQSEHKTAKKSGRPRTIHLTKEVIELLEQVRSEQNPTDPDQHVFENEDGNWWSYRQSWNGAVRKVANLAGLATTPYGFGRVSFIERAIIQNVNLKTIATLVGHANVTMTDTVYARRLNLYGDHLREAAAQIASAPFNKRAG